MDFGETFADMVILLMLWHTIGGLTDFIVSLTLERAYNRENRSAEALEDIAKTLADLEDRFIGGGEKVKKDDGD